MKTKFSRSWKRSVQPRKQRKYRMNAPIHLAKKFVSSHLSKELMKKYNKRNITLIKGDKVKITRGSFKGKTGTVEDIDRKKFKAYITGIEVMKKDGSKTRYPVDTSNLLITELKLDDKKRLKKLSTEVKNG